MLNKEDGVYTSNIKEKRQIIEDNNLIKEYRDMLKDNKEIFLQNIIDLHTERDELLKKANNNSISWGIIAGVTLGLFIGYTIWGVI